MRPEKVFKGLDFVGTADGRRRSYQVFEAPNHFVVVAMNSPRSGYFSVVDRDAVEAARMRFAGKTVTSSDLDAKLAKGRVRQFTSLNTLYVLVAQRQAAIDRSLSKAGNSSLFFKIKPKPVRKASH
jgi:hypothetical protein